MSTGSNMALDSNRERRKPFERRGSCYWVYQHLAASWGWSRRQYVGFGCNSWRWFAEPVESSGRDYLTKSECGFPTGGHLESAIFHFSIYSSENTLDLLYLIEYRYDYLSTFVSWAPERQADESIQFWCRSSTRRSIHESITKTHVVNQNNERKRY